MARRTRTRTRASLSAAEARRLALAAQGFADGRTAADPNGWDLRRVLKRVGLLQIDSVNVLERAHYLPAFSRLGPYPRDLLDRASQRAPRRLFEYWGHEASLLPVELHPLLRWRMERAADHAWRGMLRIQRERPELVGRLLDQVAERGPVSASELADPGPRRSGPWWDWSEVKWALEWLFVSGRLTTARRRRFERVYDLPARVLPAAALNAPTPSAADESWQRLVQKASDDLSQRVVSSPATTAEVHQHVSLRMLRLLAGDTEQALEPIPHISPAEQDYWSRQIFTLATYLDHHSQPDDKRRAAASVTHLDEAVSHLRELGSLSLRNLSFCKNVYGYGAIEPYEADTFTPGQQVSLYVEVENFHSKSGEKGFSTLLGGTYELLDDKGKRVSGGDFPDVDDCCRSRRRDFHIQYGLSLPQNLAPGRYRLELIIKDRQSDKLGHATAPFEIRGGQK